MDGEEFAERVERIRARMFRTACMYLGSDAMACDAVDESVYRALKSLKKLRNAEYFETWLTRILINECKKQLRRIRREQPLDTIPETAQEEFDALPLRDAVQRLPDELREVVILRYFSGYTVAETAKCLELAQGTVATRQRRALGILRLELAEEVL